MKYYYKAISKFRIVLILLFLIILSLDVFAQDEDSSVKEKLRVYFDCEFHSLDTVDQLFAFAKARIGEKRRILPVNDLEISFYYIQDTLEISLGIAKTNSAGIAIFSIKKSENLMPDENGQLNFRARFEGDERFKKASKKVKVEKVEMEIAFIEIDSVKTVQVNAFLANNNDESMPLNDVDISFYVPGSFSLLKIGEKSLVDGQTSIEFPITLPGDENGNLSILAKIEDNEEYGMVETSGVMDWGAPLILKEKEKRRGLGDTDAPLWMVYTLIVLMSAVWFHYLYVFYVIYRIKRQGGS